MKKLLLIPLVLFFADINAQSLSSNASRIQQEYPSDYRQTIRHHAVDKWENEHDMIVYEINKQSDALFSLVNKFESQNTRIAYDAISKWSYDGYERRNQNHWDDLETFNIESLIKLHCEWDMVEYEYDKQTTARKAY